MDSRPPLATAVVATENIVLTGVRTLAPRSVKEKQDR